MSDLSLIRGFSANAENVKFGEKKIESELIGNNKRVLVVT
jgi:hypothetical protein